MPGTQNDPVDTVEELRDAIQNTSLATIYVASGDYYVSDDDGDGGFEIHRDVEIVVVDDGSGGRANFYAAEDFSKGIFVVFESVNITFQGIGFYDTKDFDNSASNVAGIRHQGSNLNVINCWFENNGNGILGHPLGANGDVVIDQSVFRGNGQTSSQEHGIYLNGFNSASITESEFRDSSGGHHVKLVVDQFAIVDNNTFDDYGAPASAAIDSTGGGDLTVTNNTFIKSADAAADMFINYSVQRGTGASGEITITNNEFISYQEDGIVFDNLVLYNRSGAVAFLEDNILMSGGSGTDYYSINPVLGNAYETPNSNTLDGNPIILAFRSRAGQGTEGADDFFFTYQNEGRDYLAYEVPEVFDGRGGNDLLVSNDQYNFTDVFFGGSGDDVLSGRDDGDFLYGGDGNDTIFGGSTDGGEEVFSGGEGNDLILIAHYPDDPEWEPGRVFIDGGPGNDTIDGRDSESLFDASGGLGDDLIIGGPNLPGDTTYLNGGDGDDTIYPGTGQEDANGSLGAGDVIIYEGTYDTGSGGDLTFTPHPYEASTYVISYGTNGVTEELGSSSGDEEVIVNFEFVQFSNGYYDLINSTWHGNATLPGADLPILLGVPRPPDPFYDPDFDFWQGGGSGGTNDSIIGTTGPDDLSGGDGNDTINGQAGNDTLAGDAGADSLSGNDGYDWLEGGSGADTLNGGGEDDTLFGGGNNDFEFGHIGDDSLIGNSGDDTLNGSIGDDTLDGGPGDDKFNVDSVGDVVVESPGEGTDTVLSYIAYQLPSNVENLILQDGVTSGDGNTLANAIWGSSTDDVIDGQAGNDTIYGNEGDDDLSGGGNNDFLSGGVGSDTLRGNAGDDLIQGSEADDWLNGTGGNDTLIGGVGTDTLLGGSGVDRFEFHSGDFIGAIAASADLIKDFSHSDGDLIDISGVDADTSTGGDDDFIFLGTTAFSSRAGELRYEFDGADTHILGDQDGDGSPDFMIALEGQVNVVLDDLIGASVSAPSGDSIPYPQTTNTTSDNYATSQNDFHDLTNLNNGFYYSLSGDDYVYSNGWSITIDLGPGDDVIDIFGYSIEVFGGAGSDYYVFDDSVVETLPSWETDYWADIRDFEDGVDKIAFLDGAQGMNEFSDVQSVMEQSGDDVVINFPGHDQDIIIRNMSVSDVDPGDFLFVGGSQSASFNYIPSLGLESIALDRVCEAASLAVSAWSEANSFRDVLCNVALC